jgi:hypothetical protein
MCSSHLSSSIAMSYHRWTSPSLFSLIRVVFCPVVGSVVVLSVRSSGRSTLMCLTSDFLFVMMTPPIARGLLTNAVSSCLAGFEIGPRVSFPTYVIDRIAIRFSALGKLKNAFRIDKFLM